MKLGKILYPTDFSEHSLCALPFALDLAGQYGAELHCLYVVDETYHYWAGPGEAVPAAAMPMDEIMNASRTQMEEFVAEHFGAEKDAVVRQVLPGRPFVEIIRYARDQEIDLIVIATHGRGALASMLLGSVTEKVVRKSMCPVLTIRHPEHRFESP